MGTDVIAFESLVAAATEAAKRPDGSVPDADVAAKVDELALHRIDLRFDRELTAAEAKAVGDAAFAELLQLEAEKVAEPHVVHEEPVIVIETSRSYDPHDGKPAGTDVNGPYWETVDRRRVQATMTCPDCGQGLVSRGNDLVCSQVPRRTAFQGCHPQCFVACGRPR